MSLYTPYGAAQMKISTPFFYAFQGNKVFRAPCFNNSTFCIILGQFFLLHIVFTEIAPIAYLQNQQS